MNVQRARCHCGRIRCEVDGEVTRVEECNCSICRPKGYLHWIVPRQRVRILTPMEDIATYTFNTGVAQHHFCPVCGVSPFYVPRSDPDKIDVNARCIEGIDLGALEVQAFDGANWESAYEKNRGA